MSDKSDFYREEREYESKIDAYFEKQERQRIQELERQRARNGGYTDDELSSEIEPYDEFEDIRKTHGDWEDF